GKGEVGGWGRWGRGVGARLGLRVKAAVCDLLLARLALERGALANASRRAAAALERTQEAGSPALVVQAHFIQGLIAEAAGNGDKALAELESAPAAPGRPRRPFCGGRPQGGVLEGHVRLVPPPVPLFP